MPTQTSCTRDTRLRTLLPLALLFPSPNESSLLSAEARVTCPVLLQFPVCSQLSRAGEPLLKPA